MALRTREFRQHLIAHEYKQEKEGWCWPALVLAILHSQGQNYWTKDKIAKEMGTTTKFGTDTDDVTKFLLTLNIPSFPMDGISFQELVALMGILPQSADAVACIWDKRVSPGYTKLTDPPESHNIAVIETPLVRGRRRVKFYDTSTYIGGLLDWNSEKWNKAWSGEPKSGMEPDRFGNMVSYISCGLLIIGLSSL